MSSITTATLVPAYPKLTHDHRSLCDCMQLTRTESFEVLKFIREHKKDFSAELYKDFLTQYDAFEEGITELESLLQNSIMTVLGIQMIRKKRVLVAKIRLRIDDLRFLVRDVKRSSAMAERDRAGRLVELDFPPEVIRGNPLLQRVGALVTDLP